jgi:exosortase
MIGSRSMRNGWTMWHLIGAVALVGVAVVLTREAWADIVRVGIADEESSHILLVPVVVAWLLWVRRERFRNCTPKGKWIGTLLILAGWYIWSYGYHHQHQASWHIGAVVIAVGGLLTVLGRDVLRKFLPAFVALVFLIPVPSTTRQRIAIPMQTATASATQAASETLGVKVERRGNLLHINGNDVAVAEACNGMRMVFTLILVSYLFAFTTLLRGYVRAIILIASPLTALVANVFRLVPTVWMYGYVSNDAAELFHDISGWVMLVVAFLSLMGIVRALRWAMVPVTPYALASANA